MKILYISQYFPPEAGATQARALEMTRYLAEKGHDVTVLCNVPNHPSGVVAEAYRRKWIYDEYQQGVRIIRTWVFTRPQKNILVRAGFYASFMISSLMAGLKLTKDFDIVLATSPPPMTGITGWLLSRLNGAVFIYEVRDLWREMAQQLGAIRNPLWIWLGVRFDRFLYQRADCLVAVTRGIQESLITKGWAAKTRLIRNGANPEQFSDQGRSMRGQLGWQNKFVVLYAGVLGLAQGMDTLCALVERMRSEPAIQFAIVGTGPKSGMIKRFQAEKKLENLTLLGEIAHHEMAGIISAADCGLVPLKKKPLFLGAVPTKMFDYLACQRPVVVSVDGEAREILSASRAGIYVEPEDVDGMAQAIRFLHQNPDKCAEMGKSGRKFVLKNFTRRQAAIALEALFCEFTGKLPNHEPER